MVGRGISKYLAAERTEVVGFAWIVSRIRSAAALTVTALFVMGRFFFRKFLMPSPNDIAGGYWFTVFDLVFPLNFGDRIRFN